LIEQRGAKSSWGDGAMVAMTFYPGEKGKRKAGGMERRGQGGKKKRDNRVTQVVILIWYIYSERNMIYIFDNISVSSKKTYSFCAEKLFAFPSISDRLVL